MTNTRFVEAVITNVVLYDNTSRAFAITANGLNIYIPKHVCSINTFAVGDWCSFVVHENKKQTNCDLVAVTVSSRSPISQIKHWLEDKLETQDTVSIEEMLDVIEKLK